MSQNNLKENKLHDTYAGKLITADFHYHHKRRPVYAIVLPKNKFLNLFEGEKGYWPNDKLRNNLEMTEIYNKFSFFIPCSKKHEDFTKVLPKEYFLKYDNLIGLKVLGNLYSYSYKRKLGLEIVSKKEITSVFNLNHLKLIYGVRKRAFEEIGGDFHLLGSVDLHLMTLINYFSGKFKKMNNDEILKSYNPLAKDMVDILRKCGFAEKVPRTVGK